MKTPPKRARPRRGPYDPDLHGPLLSLLDAERGRQIHGEGWSREHDDAHVDGEMLHAAVTYYQHAMHILNPDAVPGLLMRDDGAPVGWPWEANWWKPKDARRDLIRAGALCLAERERLLRRSFAAHVGHVDHKVRLIVRALRGALAREQVDAAQS